MTSLPSYSTSLPGDGPRFGGITNQYPTYCPPLLSCHTADQVEYSIYHGNSCIVLVWDVQGLPTRIHGSPTSEARFPLIHVQAPMHMKLANVRMVVLRPGCHGVRVCLG